MGAVCGWINKNENLEKHQDLFKEMLNSMDCRGNNEPSFHFDEHILLGNNRLGIRDAKNGIQPMRYKDYIIIYNGEIFNTEEIKNKLIDKNYEFDTNCDTEVILKGYAEYKEKILDLLEGFFAFCIYNTKTEEVFLARDRFGIKPLYYCLKNNNFIFSSTIKPILKSKIIKPCLNKDSLGEILALGPSKKQGSGIFNDINELRSAHYLKLQDGKVQIEKYWNLETKECNDTFDEAKEKVKNLLTASIKRQMTSDVEIATLLSGGLDSSLVTAIVAQNQKEQLTTFSIDYEGNDKYFKKTDFTVSLDEHYINVMSNTFNTKHEYKTISQEDVVKYLKDALYAKDYPGMADVDSSLLWFSKEISKEFNVILSGEGADEIFGGYPWFYRDELNNREFFPWINNIDYRQNLLNENLKDKINLKQIIEDEYNRTINELPEDDRNDKYKVLFYINMTHFAQCLLERKDRMTMYSQVEARVPFVDTKLIEYLWNLPFEYKYNNNTEKYLLREAFKGVIPDEILYRKKNPYPKTHNPQFLDAVSNLLRERLKNKNSKMYKIFDVDKINELLESDEDDVLPWYGQLMTKPQLIAYLYEFDLWLEEYDIEIDL